LRKGLIRVRGASRIRMLGRSPSISSQAKKLALLTLSKARWMITEFVLPHIGSRPINKITPADVLAACARLKLAANTRRRIEQNNTSARSFGMPSPLAVPSETSRSTCAGHLRPPRLRIMLLSPIPRKLERYWELLMATAVSL